MSAGCGGRRSAAPGKTQPLTGSSWNAVVQQPDDQLPVPFTRRPDRHAHSSPPLRSTDWRLIVGACGARERREQDLAGSVERLPNPTDP